MSEIGLAVRRLGQVHIVLNLKTESTELRIADN